MRINEDYIDIDSFDKDDVLTKDVEIMHTQEKKPRDFYFCVAIDFCNINESEKPICRKKLERSFDTMPCINDYLLIYGSECDFTEDVSEVNIYIDKNFRNASEVYKMMFVLVKIFNTNNKDDIRFTFFVQGGGCSNSTFMSLVRQREKNFGISDGYFYDFFNMCMMAMDMKCDPQKCADFIGFDFANYIKNEIEIYSSYSFGEIKLSHTLSLDRMFSDYPQKKSIQTFRYYLSYIALNDYKETVHRIPANEIINFIKTHFSDTIFVKRIWMEDRNDIMTYLIYLGAIL